MRGQRMYLELVIIILLMVISVPFIPMLANECQNPAVKHYEDKTALTVQNAIEIDDSLYKYNLATGKYYQCYDGATVALMLLIQDEYSQAPNMVRISGVTSTNGYTDKYYKFDAKWPGDKYAIVNSTYNDYIYPHVNKKTVKFSYVYAGSAPGVTQDYFWYEFGKE